MYFFLCSLLSLFPLYFLRVTFVLWAFPHIYPSFLDTFWGLCLNLIMAYTDTVFSFIPCAVSPVWKLFILITVYFIPKIFIWFFVTSASSCFSFQDLQHPNLRKFSTLILKLLYVPISSVLSGGILFSLSFLSGSHIPMVSLFLSLERYILGY